MSGNNRASSDVAFTRAVKAVQERLGSREGYAKLEAKGGWRTTVTPELSTFLAQRDSAFLATASAEGQPYIQHRGGPRGFIKVLDPHTLAFADFAGNRQYISLGNLSENERAQLFLIDYANQRRVKIWGRARMVEDDPELVAALHDPTYKAKAERVLVFTIEAWDVNCPQHIPRKFDQDEVDGTFAHLRDRIAALEAEVATLRGSPQG